MDFKVYLKSIGAKAGDKLEFVDYSDRAHTHWGFDSPRCTYKDFYVGEDGYMHSTHEGEDYKHHTNWGFIFKLKEKTEKVSRPIWCGKLFGKMTEAEKGAFLLDVLAGKKAYYGDCGNSVDGPEDGRYETVKEYAQRFDKARVPAYYYYSSRAFQESEGTVRRLEKEIADLKRQQEDKERSVKYLKQKQEEKEQQLAKLLS